jgi:hypothetical protein
LRLLVITSNDLYVPVLQLHHKTKDGQRTIAPLGKIKLVITSPEYELAIKLGYKINILEGYYFEKGNIFSKFVTDLYNLRINNKGSALDTIAKLMVNSLYGRFGMEILNISYKFINMQNIFSEYEIVDYLDLLENGALITYKDSKLLNKEQSISISISSAITAYARCYLITIIYDLIKLGINVYYLDTDCIVTDKPIPSEYVGKELGLFKLEKVYKEFIALGPKIYYGLPEDGTKPDIKIKGYKNITNLSINDFRNLLTYNKELELYHTKWYRDLIEGKITIKEQIYHLTATDNKRNFVIKNNKIINTKSYIINNLTK